MTEELISYGGIFMKRTLIIFLFAISALVLQSKVADSASFSDVHDELWAKNEIRFLTSKGIINGHSDGTFRPNDYVTRAQAAIMMNRALPKINTTQTHSRGFQDIKNNFAYTDILKSLEKGLFKIEGTYFYPNKPLSRQEMARILVVGFGLEGGESEAVFRDVKEENPYFSYINTIRYNNITYGVGESTFAPNKPVTRAQFSSFLARVKNPSQFLKNNRKMDRPHSFINSKDVLQAKKKIQKEEWANDYWVNLKKEADKWLKKDISVPSEGGGHPSWFVCKDGTKLYYQSEFSKQHYCPSDQKYYGDEQVQAGWRFYRHDELSKATRTLANAYILSDDEKYAKKAKEILLNYANKYPKYEVQEKKGRMYWQSLDEAVSIVDISYAYDLIYESNVLTEANRKTIETNLLVPASKTIANHNMGKSNWQAWHNAALGMIGFVLQDRDLIGQALYGEQGVYNLLENGVLENGMWWEGSLAYHMYTLTAFNILAEGAQQWGEDLYSHPKLKKMFDAPIQYAYPNLTLPANNNGGEYGHSLVGFVSSRGFYEYEAAYAHYNDPMYGSLLQKKYNQPGINRYGEYALFFGKEIEVNPDLEFTSKNFSGVGHAILRSNNGDSSNYISLDYGPHGGAHGHYDKLQLDMVLGNYLLAADMGSPHYGHPLYKSWYKNTVSHNTVVVDGINQNESKGNLVHYVVNKNLKFIQAQSNDVYDGVTYDRLIWMQDEYVLDWFSLESKQVHTYDWMFHGNGEFGFHRVTPQFKEGNMFKKENGYQNFSNTKLVKTSGNWSGIWDKGNNSVYMLSLTGSPTSVITSNRPGPATDPYASHESVIQRKVGKKEDFIIVYQPLNKKGANAIISGERIGSNEFLLNKGEEYDQLYYNKSARKLEIIAAQVTSDKSLDKKLGTAIEIDKRKGILTIQFPDFEQVSQMSVAIEASGVSTVLVNNKKVPFTKVEEYILIDINKK
jgi:hypothetical protein